jgi:hypothetical protein
MITVVIGVVSSIFALKWYLLKSPQDTRVAIAGMPLGGIIASFANAVQIQVRGTRGAKSLHLCFGRLCTCAM